VIDRKKSIERIIVEFPQKPETKETYLSDMSPDGRYGICMLSSSNIDVDAYRNAIVSGTKTKTGWDAIGLIALPEPN
jgi:hypothetical protein